MSPPAGLFTDQTETLTDSGQRGHGVGEERMFLRWCFPLPALPPLVLDAQKRTIGREESCDATLSSGRVSRVHAEIRRSGPVFTIFDLASKNGVFVNGERVGQAIIQAGDVIRIGDHVAVAVVAKNSTELRLALVAESIWGGYRHRAAAIRAQELATSPLPIVIHGATGSGKELMARAIHGWSGRSGPFLAVNSAVYSRNMAAAELFGFKKGAFTGAEQASPGHIRAAQGGTLFLDEVLDLSLEVQAMLLRALEQHEVQPLGEARPVPIDVRFVAATQVPLSEAVAAGRFRADLRARLEGGVVELPSLNQCREIVPELLVELCRRREVSSSLELSASVAEALCLHDWALNVRELDMLAGRLSVRTSTKRLETADLELRQASSAPPGLRRSSTPPAGTPAVPGRRPSNAPYDPVEVERLREALERHRGNVSRAVAELGISRQRAYRMLPQLKPGS